MSLQRQAFELSYKPFGNKAILIEWPQRIDDDILDDIVRLRNALTVQLKKSVEIVDVVAAYNSITIIHKHSIKNLTRRVEILKKIYSQSKIQSKKASYCYHIPVCYDSDLASDLNSYLRTKNLSLEELISLHTKPNYRVCFFGFIPGFMYLSGLISELHCPRKADPSTFVAKGSIAIGGNQTGIYPSASPGGWHVIGSSPLEFIGSKSALLRIVEAGDRIRFKAILRDEYLHIQEQIAKEAYSIKREILDA